MRGRTAALAGVALVAVVVLGALGTWRWASAVGPDVNNDGMVRIPDILEVVNAYGQTVPTATPIVLNTYIVSDPIPAGTHHVVYCDGEDAATGGGAKDPAGTYDSFPVQGGWSVYGNGVDMTAYVVCLDNPPLRR